MRACGRPNSLFHDGLRQRVFHGPRSHWRRGANQTNRAFPLALLDSALGIKKVSMCTRARGRASRTPGCFPSVGVSGAPFPDITGAVDTHFTELTQSWCVCTHVSTTCSSVVTSTMRTFGQCVTIRRRSFAPKVLPETPRSRLQAAIVPTLAYETLGFDDA